MKIKFFNSLSFRINFGMLLILVTLFVLASISLWITSTFNNLSWKVSNQLMPQLEYYSDIHITVKNVHRKIDALPHSRSKSANRVVVSELLDELNKISNRVSDSEASQYNLAIKKMTTELFPIVSTYSLEVMRKIEIEQELKLKKKQLDTLYLAHTYNPELSLELREELHQIYVDSISLSEISTSFLFKRSTQSIRKKSKQLLDKKVINSDFYNTINDPEKGVISILVKRNNLVSNLSILNTQTSFIIEQLSSISLSEVTALQDIVKDAAKELNTKSAYYKNFLTTIIFLTTCFSIIMMVYFHKNITTRLITIANNLVNQDSQAVLEKETHGSSEISLIAKAILRYKANNKRQRDKIASSVEQLKFIIEHSSQAVLIYRENTIIYSNNSGQSILNANQSLTNHIIPRHLLKAIDGQTYLDRLSLGNSHFKFYATDIDWDGTPSRLALLMDITNEVEKEKQLMKNLKAATDESFVDAMTGLYNRRKLDYFIEQNVSQEYTIILTDIDWFKAYNDHYGHAEGDTCIIQVAKTLKENLRSDNDLAIRYGGEEFLIILMDSNIAQAEAVAQRIQSNIKSYQIPHEKSDFGYLTLSLGIAHSSESGPEGAWHTLFEIADQRLYKAKEQGRAQAVSKANSA
ncbi:GGDEF domain-containing protein [Marinomonas sp. C2222]|uniref:diguanylate cyclase n=1 Tax=Marinomonas sargassi TaxID=2984494 RepID=A0ABT2YU45_9GAMM|nr:diguanylate cyclase [Marinomonas sargassi]MCV2403414.1 GGDEF domain-containing protein [Marinomonas sargassi]